MIGLATADSFGVERVGEQVLKGFGLGEGPVKVAQGTHAILAQEVRSPFAGEFTLTVRLRAERTSRELFLHEFVRNFNCKLVMFQFANPNKKITERQELASAPIQPTFAEQASAEFQQFELTKMFVSPKPGTNFSFGSGLGVALIVEKTSPGELEFPADGKPRQALIRIDELTLEFSGKPINEDVKV